MIWFFIGVLIYYLIGCCYLIRDWCKRFGEVGLGILLLIIIVVWVAWPGILIDNVLSNLNDKIVFRCKAKVRLTEGYDRKGGINHGPSRVVRRPPPPGSMKGW